MQRAENAMGRFAYSLGRVHALRGNRPRATTVAEIADEATAEAGARYASPDATAERELYAQGWLDALRGVPNPYREAA